MTKEEQTSHDQNFKNLILDYPRASLEFFAGAEAEGIDENTRIIPIRQEQLKERLGERFHELDTPLLAEWPDGRRKAVVFNFEEESSAARFSIHRLGHYCLSLAEFFGTDRIVPVVIFLHSGKYPKELKIGGDHGTYLHFRFIACDLRKIPAEKHMESTNIVARLNLPNMKCRKQDRIAVYAHAQEGLVELEPDTEKRLKYIDFVDCYANLDEKGFQEYREKYLSKSRHKEEIMGLMKMMREEGIQIGVSRGIPLGELSLLKRLLVRRFRQIPAWAQSRMENADRKDLEIWSDRILDASSVEEVFGIRNAGK
ncbi:MAG: hypothetical protein AB7S75_15610 [Desulfococcaceae bacterium]